MSMRGKGGGRALAGVPQSALSATALLLGTWARKQLGSLCGRRVWFGLVGHGMPVWVVGGGTGWEQEVG